MFGVCIVGALADMAVVCIDAVGEALGAVGWADGATTQAADEVRERRADVADVDVNVVLAAQAVAAAVERRLTRAGDGGGRR